MQVTTDAVVFTTMIQSFFKPHAAKPIVFVQAGNEKKRGIVNIIYLLQHPVAIFMVVSCSDI